MKKIINIFLCVVLVLTSSLCVYAKNPTDDDIRADSFIIGKYLINMDALTPEIAELAEKSAISSSDSQNKVYFKSNINGKYQWFDITNAQSIDDLDIESAKIVSFENVINKIKLNYWVKSIDNIIDLNSYNNSKISLAEIEKSLDDSPSDYENLTKNLEIEFKRVEAVEMDDDVKKATLDALGYVLGDFTNTEFKILEKQEMLVLDYMSDLKNKDKLITENIDIATKRVYEIKTRIKAKKNIAGLTELVNKIEIAGDYVKKKGDAKTVEALQISSANAKSEILNLENLIENKPKAIFEGRIWDLKNEIANTLINKEKDEAAKIKKVDKVLKSIVSLDKMANNKIKDEEKDEILSSLKSDTKDELKEKVEEKYSQELLGGIKNGLDDISLDDFVEKNIDDVEETFDLLDQIDSKVDDEENNTNLLKENKNDLEVLLKNIEKKSDKDKVADDLDKELEDGITDLNKLLKDESLDKDTKDILKNVNEISKEVKDSNLIEGHIVDGNDKEKLNEKIKSLIESKKKCLLVPLLKDSLDNLEKYLDKVEKKVSEENKNKISNLKDKIGFLQTKLEGLDTTDKSNESIIDENPEFLDDLESIGDILEDILDGILNEDNNNEGKKELNSIRDLKDEMDSDDYIKALDKAEDKIDNILVVLSRAVAEVIADENFDKKIELLSDKIDSIEKAIKSKLAAENKELQKVKEEAEKLNKTMSLLNDTLKLKADGGLQDEKNYEKVVAIKDLRDEVAKLKTDKNNEIKNNISELKTEIDELKKEITLTPTDKVDIKKKMADEVGKSIAKVLKNLNKLNQNLKKDKNLADKDLLQYFKLADKVLSGINNNKLDEVLEDKKELNALSDKLPEELKVLLNTGEFNLAEDIIPNDLAEKVDKATGKIGEIVKNLDSNKIDKAIENGNELSKIVDNIKKNDSEGIKEAKNKLNNKLFKIDGIKDKLNELNYSKDKDRINYLAKKLNEKEDNLDALEIVLPESDKNLVEKFKDEIGELEKYIKSKDLNSVEEVLEELKDTAELLDDNLKDTLALLDIRADLLDLVNETFGDEKENEYLKGSIKKVIAKAFDEILLSPDEKDNKSALEDMVDLMEKDDKDEIEGLLNGLTDLRIISDETKSEFLKMSEDIVKVAVNNELTDNDLNLALNKLKEKKNDEIKNSKYLYWCEYEIIKKSYNKIKGYKNPEKADIVERADKMKKFLINLIKEFQMEDYTKSELDKIQKVGKNTEKNNNFLSYFSLDSLLTNNKNIKIGNPVFIENKKIIVPVRSVFEGLGAKVDYISSNKSNGYGSKVIIKLKDKNQVELVIGKAVVEKVNGKNISTVPRLLNGSAYVSLKYVTNKLDINIGYDSLNKVCFIENYQLDEEE